MDCVCVCCVRQIKCRFNFEIVDMPMPASLYCLSDFACLQFDAIASCSKFRHTENSVVAHNVSSPIHIVNVIHARVSIFFYCFFFFLFSSIFSLQFCNSIEIHINEYIVEFYLCAPEQITTRTTKINGENIEV